MASNTDINIGIRRMIYSLATPEYRNYEPQGGQLYAAVRVNLEYQGTTYNPGDTIPYDNEDESAYTDDALMEMYFNQGWVDPVS
jgi:hypothetical protein